MLHNAVRSICARAGWKERPPDEKGNYPFALEGGIFFTLSSPDGDRLLACSPLLVPEAGQEIAGETLAAVMRITAARFSRLNAVTSLDPESGRLELYAATSLRGGDAGVLEIFMEGFLNELSFWKAQPALTDRAAFIALR
jgi:hypothetical protein